MCVPKQKAGFPRDIDQSQRKKPQCENTRAFSHQGLLRCPAPICRKDMIPIILAALINGRWPRQNAQHFGVKRRIVSTKQACEFPDFSMCDSNQRQQHLVRNRTERNDLREKDPNFLVFHVVCTKLLSHTGAIKPSFRVFLPQHLHSVRVFCANECGDKAWIGFLSFRFLHQHKELYPASLFTIRCSARYQNVAQKGSWLSEFTRE